MNDLVAQRKEIKRLEREWEDREINKGEAERLDKEEEARRELEKFERTAQGLEVSSVAANGNRKKRKVDELESAEIADSRKLKSGEEKVDGTTWAVIMERIHLLICCFICRLRLLSGFPAWR